MLGYYLLWKFDVCFGPSTMAQWLTSSPCRHWDPTWALLVCVPAAPLPMQLLVCGWDNFQDQLISKLGAGDLWSPSGWQGLKSEQPASSCFLGCVLAESWRETGARTQTLPSFVQFFSGDICFHLFCVCCSM